MYCLHKILVSRITCYCIAAVIYSNLDIKLRIFFHFFQHTYGINLVQLRKTDY